MAVVLDQRTQGHHDHCADPSCGTARFLYSATLKQSWFDEAIPLPKRIRKLPEVIAAGDVADILNRTANLKHWTIIATLYATGVRLDELIHLKISDIDSKLMVIHIRQGKGRIPRDIVLSPILLERLRIYCRRYKPRLWLFPSERRSEGPADDSISLPKRRAARRSQAAHSSPFVSARLRDPHAGSRRRSPHDSTSTRAR